MTRFRNARRFLMVCCWNPGGISTVPEYISSWKRASQFRISVLNLWGRQQSGWLVIPPSVDIDDFDGVILHPTVSYFPQNLFNLDTQLHQPFEKFRGIKVIVKQDEHVQSRKWAEFIRAKQFDVLVTCLPPSEVTKVYPDRAMDGVEIIHALTGYVPPHFRNIRTPPHSERTVDIGYRGSNQPLSTGRLGFEKRHIGAALEKALEGRDLIIDVSSRWEDRLTGKHWINFLAAARLVPGTESGSCLFDFDGSVEQWCRKYTKRNAHLDSLGEAFYRTAHDEFLHRFEGNVDYAVISPRHFEVAATRSVQLLYEGQYSGVMEPYRHFLPLKRDLSNLDELLDIARDEKRAKAITNAAFEEIILNDNYSYDRFVESVDDAINRKLAEKARSAPPLSHIGKKTGYSALMLMSHDPVLDPRIDWMSKGLVAKGFSVVEIGTYRFSEVGEGPTRETLSDGRQRIRVERLRHDYAFAPNPEEIGRGLSIGQQYLLGIYTQMMLPERAWQNHVDAVDLDDEARTRFSFFCSHFVNTNSALIQAARLTGRFDTVIAADLDVLPAAETIAKEHGSLLVYDAHEYWPYSDHRFRHWENEFWGQIERGLAAEADIRLTVSGPLADRMEEDYGVPFSVVPNCEPKSAALDVAEPKATGEQTIFLYLGNFAPGRNLEKLITSWANTRKDAVLWLQGPDWSYKEELQSLAHSTGLLGSRIFFPEPVPESELVKAASQADVGLIPYDPTLQHSKYCCPNKLSQYLAAGLPILCTQLDFVSSLVKKSETGLVYSFSGESSLHEMVDLLVRDPAKRRKMSQRARQFFLENYNWEYVSEEFYSTLTEQLRSQGNAGTDSPTPDFSWVESGRVMRRLTPKKQAPTATKQARTEVIGFIWRVGAKLPTPIKKIIRYFLRI